MITIIYMNFIITVTTQSKKTMMIAQSKNNKTQIIIMKWCSLINSLVLPLCNISIEKFLNKKSCLVILILLIIFMTEMDHSMQKRLSGTICSH